MTNICIICDKTNDAKSIEHIVPHSFGNEDYVIPKGSICDECNQRFSKFERKALSNSIFAMERARLGVKTKRGKPVSGKVDGIEIKGDKEFSKQVVTLGGLSDDKVSELYMAAITGKTTKVKIKSFDKSEVSVSRLLLSMGIESIYKSQPRLFREINFDSLKSYLNGSTNKDWPFITCTKECDGFKSIPRFGDRYELRKKGCELRYCQKDGLLLFRFRFGGVSMIINLLDRNTEWVGEFKEIEEHVYLYPEHYEAAYQKKLKAIDDLQSTSTKL